MKYFSSITLLSVLVLIALSSFKPSSHSKKMYDDDDDYDTLDYYTMSVAGIKLGANYGVILDKLGSPDSVKKEETQDAQLSNHFEEYFYGKDVFFVMDETVSGFELKTSKFKIDNLADLKVGDNMAKVKKRFPKSYKLRDVDNSVEDWITTVSVRFGTTDSFLEIMVQNDKIISLTTITDDGSDTE
ncbi:MULTISPECIES: hypothetical protein [unclassified Arcicella]|uniref:hypothetical protein n=1 Tax=unclassified Arcicella TaxID=2644986 RepID=UPI002854C72C|nr:MULTISPECIES: hypothetical protein [unclassified Arcicella]MDR6561140.1 hypothetical protein [Arcicella sp. BE51]MDR6811024.1 hypothetical protein [Arcicella sp. BE140]MDR6822374.1 hypothetical protein [Arcicella sp. BE139]